jgi:hypothetical protein
MRTQFMSDFTYETPDKQRYMRAVLRMLSSKGYVALYERLKNARCSINTTTNFSGKRWNAYSATIVFQVPMAEYGSWTLEDADERRLLNICSTIMPTEYGYDIADVAIAPIVDDLESKTLEEELVDILDESNGMISGVNLSRDILDNGKKMSEVYIFLYAAENYLRLFIEQVGIENHGSQYLDQIQIPSKVRRGIATRKEQEAKNEWMSLRGDSNLFYMDFKELGDIIENNWSIFGKYFPTVSWIVSKIDDWPTVAIS